MTRNRRTYKKLCAHGFPVQLSSCPTCRVSKKVHAWGFKIEVVGKGRTKAEAWEDALSYLNVYLDKIEAHELDAEDMGEEGP